MEGNLNEKAHKIYLNFRIFSIILKMTRQIKEEFDNKSKHSRVHNITRDYLDKNEGIK